MDRTIVNYRRVINDAVCNPWEPMPEVQPPTLDGLIEFIKGCEHNTDFYGNLWDHTRLQYSGTFEDVGHFVCCGHNNQFYLPEPVDPEDPRLNMDAGVDLSFECPYCGDDLRPHETQYGLVGAELHHVLRCVHCRIEVGGFVTKRALRNHMLRLKKGLQDARTN